VERHNCSVRADELNGKIFRIQAMVWRSRVNGCLADCGEDLIELPPNRSFAVKALWGFWDREEDRGVLREAADKAGHVEVLKGSQEPKCRFLN